MPARMTEINLSQGAKNAAVCGIGVLAFWFVAAFTIRLIFEQSLISSIGYSFGALWWLLFAWLLVTWVRDRTDAGDVLLDCGPFPDRRDFLHLGVIALVLSAVLASGVFSAMSRILAALQFVGPVFGVSFAAFWFVLATGRLQIRENGIWTYGSLVRWENIRQYHWSPGSTLILRSKGLLSFLMPGALPFPPECKQEVDDLLAEYCTASENWSTNEHE